MSNTTLRPIHILTGDDTRWVRTNDRAKAAEALRAARATGQTARAIVIPRGPVVSPAGGFLSRARFNVWAGKRAERAANAGRAAEMTR